MNFEYINPFSFSTAFQLENLKLACIKTPLNRSEVQLFSISTRSNSRHVMVLKCIEVDRNDSGLFGAHNRMNENQII